MDLIALELGLRPVKPILNPPNWWGEAAHQLLLKQFGPVLAQKHHPDVDGVDSRKSSDLRPFTASTLLGSVAGELTCVINFVENNRNNLFKF